MSDKLKRKLGWFQRGTTPADNVQEIKDAAVNTVKILYLEMARDNNNVHVENLENEIESLKTLSGEAFRQKAKWIKNSIDFTVSKV